jgi:hypothetical protein
MSKSLNTVVQDPRTPANLKRLTTVSIRCDVSSVAFLDISPVKLKKTVRAQLEDEGLVFDNASKSRLVIGIAVEARDVGRHVVYAVEVALREPVALPRAGTPLQMGEVDSWRHQTITGILFTPYDTAQLAKALVGEAMRQLGAFLEDWADVNDIAPTVADAESIVLASAMLPPANEDWYSKTQKIELALKALLQNLVYDPPSTATLDKFSVVGTKVNFEATVTNVPHSAVDIGGGVATIVVPAVTRIVQSFDMTDPSSVEGIMLSAKLPAGLDHATKEVSLASLATLFV